MKITPVSFLPLRKEKATRNFKITRAAHISMGRRCYGTDECICTQHPGSVFGSRPLEYSQGRAILAVFIVCECFPGLLSNPLVFLNFSKK